MHERVCCLLLLMLTATAKAETVPLFQTIDLNIGETIRASLSRERPITVLLKDVRETKGRVWGQVDRAEVTVVVNGVEATFVSGMYRLPQKVGQVQIDCPITGGLRASSHIDHWALEKDARLRIWAADSPWIEPDSFGYPVKQAWFASQTSFSNEPVAPRPNRQLYYHAGLDIGGAEGLTEVVVATEAMIVSHGLEVHPDHSADAPIQPRYDVLYLMDERGWYYRYSHLHSFEPALRLGQIVKKGDRLGLIGKEGGSGGWSHLHFEIKSRQPSGRWGTQDGYAFIWQAYLQQRQPKMLAVARPGHVIFAGETIELDATRSWTARGNIRSFDWTFSEGGSAAGATVTRNYHQPGTFYETLKVTNTDGDFDYDFVRVKVYDPKTPDTAPPRMHLAYHPTSNIRTGTEITFKGRAFYLAHGEEVWDFGDGTPKVKTESDGNVKQLAKDGYVIVKHRYQEPGDYLVHVRRTDEDGRPAEDRLHVHVMAAEQGDSTGA
jgi:murein DD-endopeptidase MepM/ murein hydrolase activator NlpD